VAESDGGAIRDLRLGDLLGRFGGQPPVAGAGSAAAVTASFAAALVAMVARRSRDSWAEAGGIAVQATMLERRCSELADADAAAFAEALDALAGAGQLAERLADAAAVPLQIAAAAADVAELAALTSERSEGTFRGDAAAAAVLAAAAAGAAGHLVRVNLGVGADDPRLEDARRACAAADAAAARALDAGP
jgi:methenyltetrahydrofolate cyclohydrolase